jgi:plastocyanin
MAAEPDPHAVLGVPRGASAADVQAAYRRLARRYHPDAPDGGDPARMRTLNAAYAALRTGSPPPPPPAGVFPSNREFSGSERPKTAGFAEELQRWAPSRRAVVGALVAVVAIVAGLAALAATGDDVVEPRVATLTAAGLRFDVDEIRLAADRPVEIRLVNRDPGQRHNVAVVEDGAVVARGEPTTGPTAVAYELGPLPAATYTFRCEIVPTMTGRVVVA